MPVSEPTQPKSRTNAQVTIAERNKTGNAELCARDGEFCAQMPCCTARAVCKWVDGSGNGEEVCIVDAMVQDEHDGCK
jgi:hypothetical protein